MYPRLKPPTFPPERPQINPRRFKDGRMFCVLSTSHIPYYVCSTPNWRFTTPHPRHVYGPLCCHLKAITRCNKTRPPLTFLHHLCSTAAATVSTERPVVASPIPLPSIIPLELRSAGPRRLRERHPQKIHPGTILHPPAPGQALVVRMAEIM